MIFKAIASVQTLLIAIFMLMIGSGALSTLIALRLQADGLSALVIGLVATSYFTGLTLGSVTVFRIVRNVGHIRAFAAFVSLFSASALTYVIVDNAVVWTGLRFIDGFCTAGVFVCLESWLNERAEPSTRGTVLAGYMIFLYSGQAVGQSLLLLDGDMLSMPFIAAAAMLSLAVIPVALTRIEAPLIGRYTPLSLRRLYSISPLGVVGSVSTGVMLGAFYALAAVHARKIGLDNAGISSFLGTVILGGVLLQWPLGYLSDRFDRRRVIVATFASLACTCAMLSVMREANLLFYLLGAMFGGFAFALYPLCVSHTNDHIDNDDRVGASGGLVLAYSVGAIIGPAVGGITLMFLGMKGLYVFIGTCAGAVLGFGLWRQMTTAPVESDAQEPFQTLPRTTPMLASFEIQPD